jgi:hypothetical protein
MSSSFQLGEQPNFANIEPCSEAPSNYIENLLAEGAAATLITRSFGLVELDERDTDLYSKFHDVFFQFMRSQIQERSKFGILQFDPGKRFDFAFVPRCFVHVRLIFAFERTFNQFAIFYCDSHSNFVAESISRF